jgi:hypothetical protein
MWWKRRKLERLFDELRGITMLERLCDAPANTTEDDRHVHNMRQTRQSELVVQIERLANRKELRRVSGEQKSARSWQETRVHAAGEPDPVRLLERLEELKRALDERDAEVHCDPRSPGAAA